MGQLVRGAFIPGDGFSHSIEAENRAGTCLRVSPGD